MSTALVARIIAVLTGVWLMFAPAVLDYTGAAETNDRIIGPIAGSFAFVACWDVLVAMRWPTVPLGAWLVVAPLLLGYADAGAWISSMVSGAVFVVTGLRGREGDDERFGGGWRSVRPSAWRTSSP